MCTVFLFIQFLIKDHELLLSLVDASHTIPAPDAVLEECAVAAALTILGEAKVVTTDAIHTLVAPLVFVAVAAIHHVTVKEQAIAVVAVFVVIGLRDQVAILQVSCAVHVVAVFHRPADHKLPLMRDFLEQFSELFKEGA